MDKSGTLTADGSVDVKAQSAGASPGNITTVYAKGTWGGGTLTVQASPDGVNFFDITEGALTADGFLNVSVKTKFLRLVLADATSPDIDYWVL